jgi:replication-associated recombination protein RarA
MQYDTYPIIASVKNKLDFFLHSKKIPHIIFHGPSGTGKRTIVNQFLSNIYGHDKAKMKWWKQRDDLDRDMNIFLDNES